MINELSNLNFAGQLALHNYNEPLLDKRLFHFIDEIRIRLPKCHVLIYTNGDHLNRKILDKLVDSGVESLIVSLHDAIGNNTYKKFINKMSKKLSLSSIVSNHSDSFGLKFSTQYKMMDITYYVPSTKMLTSRGGIIKQYNVLGNSQSFCYLPFSSCAIDYEGNLKMCCEIYPANYNHKKNGIMGNLRNASFESIWFGDRFNSLRKNILLNQNINPICSYCPGYNYHIDDQRIMYWRLFLDNI